MKPQNRHDTVQTHSPLTPVRSPVRGASDSVSRHDGPTQQGGTERPAQRGSVKAREASTLGGIQGHNHPTNKHLNQTRQNNDSHVCREGGFGTSPQRRAVCLAAQPQTTQLHTQGRGYPLNHTNHPKSRRLCSLLCASWLFSGCPVGGCPNLSPTPDSVVCEFVGSCFSTKR